MGGGYNYRPSRSTPRHIIRTGRGASRTACDAERRTMVTGSSFLTLQRRLEMAPGSGTLPLHQAAFQQIQTLYFSLYR
ncbi:hypothetical protein CBI55_25635 [Pseudomonas syringae]|nr:hypothetical protein CBI55_25635 [Pseudomonas syringae]